MSSAQLRLRNGLYIQRHAPMLRVAIPYGLLSSTQLRALASIARRYDRGYGHFTTRQNMQFNWPKLEEVPDILAELAAVEMHAIQTSGNCIRNTTSDHLAGVRQDELEDPRPWCEIIRQWSTFHPEFTYLPAEIQDCRDRRRAIAPHRWCTTSACTSCAAPMASRAFEILAGGGLGRTPIIGQVVREFLPREHLLSYLEAVLRVYNREGRRDNLHQGADQDTGALARDRRVQAARGGRVGIDQGRRPARSPRRKSRACAVFSTPPAYRESSRYGSRGG